MGTEGEPTREWGEWAGRGWAKTYEEYAAQDKISLRYLMGKDPKTGKPPARRTATGRAGTTIT